MCIFAVCFIFFLNEGHLREEPNGFQIGWEMMFFFFFFKKIGIDDNPTRVSGQIKTCQPVWNSVCEAIWGNEGVSFKKQALVRVSHQN